jgi:hypothetical protein
MKKIYGNERVIPYRPQLKAFFGSSNAAIMYAQLDYWFFRNNGESFYKFNTPCDQPKYKVGDSLKEELAFSDEEIEKALKRICRMFKSKKEFDLATDKFEGMPMCCYYDRISYTKFYFRNHEVCDYINSKDSDELPIFQDTRSIDQSVINGVLESVNCGLAKPQVADSILYLYKRLQQKITQNFENEVLSIAKSDTEGIPISEPTTTGMYENKKDGCGVSYARIAFSESQSKAKKQRNEVEMKIKAFKPLFLDLHALYRGRKSDAEDHFKKLFNKLKTSKQIDLDLQEFEMGLKNYMLECEKRNTEQMYIKHFKNFIHDMVWREYRHIAGEPIKPNNQLPTITAENAHLFNNLWG